MRASILLLSLCLLAAPLTHAKALKSKAHIDKIAKLFLEQLQAGDTPAAYNTVSPYNGLSDEQFAKRSEKGIQDMAALKQQVGNPLSIPILNKESVGEHFYKITSLVKYREAAIVCEMNFYQPDNGWYLIDISFNTDINALFD